MADLYSYHIFLFPFRVKKTQAKDLIEECTRFGKLAQCPLNKDKISKELYNEITYFYPFVGDSLYEKNGAEGFFEHWELTEKPKDLKYRNYSG